MARPIKQGMDYFPHDTDASNDEKLEMFEASYGLEGYAFYFKLLERIYRSPDFMLDCANPAVIATTLKRLGMRRDRFDKMVESAVEVGLFSRSLWKTSAKLSSDVIFACAADVERRRTLWKAKQASKGGFSPEITPQVTPQETPQETVSETRQSKAITKSNNKNNPLPPNAPNPAAGTIFQEYQNSFGLLATKTISDKLIELEDEYGREWVLDALRETGLKGARSIRYTESILQRWQTEGKNGKKRAVDDVEWVN